MKTIIRLGVCLFVVSSASLANTQTDAAKTEFKAASEEFDKAALPGPRHIPLFDEATLELPAGDKFVPASAAARLMRSMGQTVDDKKLVGMIVPDEENAKWVAIVTFIKDGYVRDDDAQHWKADDMLRRISENTDQSNASRKAHGFAELKVLGWAEAPTYDAATHRLVWGAVVKRKADPDDAAHRAVNYQTVALGRDGHLELTLASSLSSFAADKSIANALLEDIDYVPGKRYADFDKFTDRVAEYGLAALVVGVAAKKLGLIAVLLAFLAKFTKLGVAISLVVAAVTRRFSKRKVASSGAKGRQEPH
ncbi:DUF2167 domain-containing protein [Paraburkholderia susongensis]|uniref:Uncharacterized membrane-anchored protein n=1 Tax=Paraburkholderia susongensis TaxID=1515439 RepID=A0A1X7KWJ4_9BURK|nr:DUF2167 domain-containing protein [Paraburkholderia susongensis]SMG45941.1 Uncharacterized membrane-anchored protein [Paraburkholderia susongensis]